MLDVLRLHIHYMKGNLGRKSFGSCFIPRLFSFAPCHFARACFTVNKGNNKITELRTILQRESIHILNRNVGGRFGALKSDSTHHFFSNVCTKSGSLRFSVFRLLTDFVCLYNYEFWLSLCKIVRSSVILLLPLFTVKHARAKWHGAKENKRGMKQNTWMGVGVVLKVKLGTVVPLEF
jgi:hypothetical protein